MSEIEMLLITMYVSWLRKDKALYMARATRAEAWYLCRRVRK